MVDYSRLGRLSKQKGKRGERRVATLLTEFTGKNFRKVPGSGGFNKQGIIVAERCFSGDIICDDLNFIFSVESKNRPNDFSIAQILAVPEKAPFTHWWYQTISDADQVRLFPMLFFKASQSSTKTVGSEHIAITSEAFEAMGCPDEMPRLTLDIYSQVSSLVVEGNSVSVTLPMPIIVNWRIFIKHTDPTKMFR